ncbi:MAG: hypothetical protein Q9162_001505 [Coniocarpon cinnabarinum]
MEKYSKYRDPGTGIAPFFPIPPAPAGYYVPVYLLLVAIRIPLLVAVGLTYFVIIQWLPVGSLGRKTALWTLLGIPGIWWVDLQVDGVKRGNLSKASNQLPGPGSIIVSSSTSPLDALYLAAIFDPVFTRCYTFSRRLQTVSLLSAMFQAVSPASLLGAPTASDANSNSDLLSIPQLVKRNPTRVIVVFAESTTTNGRGIMPLSPCLASTPESVPIFPTSLRYSPADVTTPVPGWRATWRFFWNLCSVPTHTIRVRVAEPLRNAPPALNGAAKATATEPNSYATNFFDRFQRETKAAADETTAGRNVMAGSREESADEQPLNAEERKPLDRIGESLARLGRVKRVALNVRDKADFVRLWRKRGRA